MAFDKAATRTAPADAKPARPRASWAQCALLAVAVVFLLALAKPLLLPVVVAVVFTLVLAGPVQRLRSFGIPEWLGAGVVVTSALSVLVLLGAMLASPAAEWWYRAPATASELLDSLDRVRNAVLLSASGPSANNATASVPANNTGPGAPAPAATGPSRKARTQPPAPPPPQHDSLREQLASEGLSFTRVLLGHVLAFALSAASTVILLYFLLASEHWLLSRTVEAVPRRRTRALVLGGFRQAKREIGLFLGTQFIINVGLGAATAFAVSLLGLPDPVLWGTVVAVLNFVPYLGPLLVSVMLVLAGAMSFGVDSAALLGPAAAFLALHGIEANFVSPIVIGHRLRLAPVSVFLSVMVWGWLWGIAGALIAVPMLLGLRALCRRTPRLKRACVYLGRDDGAAPNLRSLLKAKRRTSGARAEGGA
jgi:predicted PurR-regulated permease PerM